MAVVGVQINTDKLLNYADLLKVVVLQIEYDSLTVCNKSQPVSQIGPDIQLHELHATVD